MKFVKSHYIHSNFNNLFHFHFAGIENNHGFLPDGMASHLVNFEHFGPQLISLDSTAAQL
jgi:hypothetical protein